MKECFKCHRVLSIDEFYRHPRMADGHLNKCKECTKKDVKSDYRRDLDKHKKYDLERNKTPERKLSKAETQKRSHITHPNKYKAHYAVSNAVRDGRLIKMPCCKCGTTVGVQAHHDDYSKPLDVKWYCQKCHRKEEHPEQYSVLSRDGAA